VLEAVDNTLVRQSVFVSLKELEREKVAEDPEIFTETPNWSVKVQFCESQKVLRPLVVLEQVTAVKD
tara:strand:+ start:129 stop:329 length:201 start_codon:yes stop_codon:yes gene_type:complete